MKPQEPKLKRAKDSARHLAMGVSTLWRKSKEEPDFPQPIRLSERVTVWKVADLDDYIERKAASSTGGEAA